MKSAIVIAGAVGAVAAGASTFLLVRTGKPAAGAASREELVQRTVDGINAGDRDALLAILVGPESDRLAATCDDEGVKSSEAREAARVQRVQDGIDETQRRVLVVDHLGNDRSEVQVAQGEAIDPHCTARAAIVKHETTVAFHDAKDAKFVAKLVAIEIAGRWFLAQVPIARAGHAQKPLYADGGFKQGELSKVCERWWAVFQQVKDCETAPAWVTSRWNTISSGLTNAREHGDRIGPYDDECTAEREKLEASYPACIDQ